MVLVKVFMVFFPFCEGWVEVYRELVWIWLTLQGKVAQIMIKLN